MAKPKATILKIAVVAIALIVFAEAILRIAFAAQGYTVGVLTPNWFPKVSTIESPKFDNSFFADSSGMFIANQKYWAKHNVAINNLGFLGNDWSTQDTNKKKILFIGDSFTWGAGAEPIQQGFVSRLTAKTHLAVYNTGIPGADPAQYQFIAERYIPKLKPAYTFVMLYLGNDIVREKRAIVPNKSLYYPTDAGWFPGYYQGRYFDNFNSSYQFYLNKYTPKGKLATLLCHTAIGTAIYAFPLRLEERNERDWLKKATTTNEHLLSIAKVAKQYNSQLIIVPIPYLGTDFTDKYYDEPKSFYLTEYKMVFSDIEDYLMVIPFKPEHFHPLPNGHFNNDGHYEVSKSINEILKN